MNFSVFAPFRGVTGYDYMVRGFLREWHKQGHNVQLFEHEKWSNLRAATDIDDILTEMVGNQIPDPEFHINFCLLDQCMLNPNTVNICYTMFESSSICKEWVDSATRLDLIIVPTEFNRKTFTQAGIPEYKVRVIPIPLDISKILNANTGSKVVSFSGEEISKYKNRFLNVSEFISRKNVEGLLQSWVEETRGADDTCLVLKLNSNSGLKLDFLKRRFESFLRGRKCAPVYLLIDYLSDAEMVELYKSCTHYVSASFGEGWGLSESICGVLGKKIVAPKSTAFLDYLTSDNSYPYDCKDIGANQEGPTARYYVGSKWYAPIQFFLRKAIRKSIDDNNKDDNTKNERLSKEMIVKCDSEKVANNMINTVSKYSPQPAVSDLNFNESKNNFSWMMICKSLNTKCGIADYTDMLCKSMIKLQGKSYDGWVVANGDAYTYQHSLDSCMGKAHIVNMQLEYQFISPRRLKYFIDYCTNADIVPVVTMHTTNPRAIDYHEILKQTKCPLIVSSNPMKEVLTDNGFMDSQIKVIPMGMSTDFVQNSTVENERFRIGFFGFTYQHKGIDKLLRFMTKFGSNRECLILSNKPENDRGYFDKIQSLYKKSAINTNWVSDYLDEKSIVECLSTCDLIFLPYSEYGGCATSAAIRTCLKAGVPIAAFDTNFFNDVVREEGLVEFIGRDPDNFEEWSYTLDDMIINKIDNNTVNSSKVSFASKRDKFLSKYSWDRIAELYVNHYRDLLMENKQR